jgi:hypothetical protein
MRSFDRLAHGGYAQKINESRGNLVLILFSTFMVAFFLSTHVVLYLVSNADNGIAFVIDMEDKGDSEENEGEEIFVAGRNTAASLKNESAHLNDYSGLMVKHQLPLPATPFLGMICPPPDAI